ncbi:hypothetical protein AADEFJLK_02312 [Methylovulum psychrotolerans]|uniref:Uncharacterized protein n=1 Tax=Methylovulum psychrotolerans TaxID=1704499 RepID=A0A2S5CMP2_9GAMM|nr:hypothetical protein AADEFJLK_02312 [Methylovulum psychrotolerans]
MINCYVVILLLDITMPIYTARLPLLLIPLEFRQRGFPVFMPFGYLCPLGAHLAAPLADPDKACGIRQANGSKACCRLTSVTSDVSIASANEAAQHNLLFLLMAVTVAHLRWRILWLTISYVKVNIPPLHNTVNLRARPYVRSIGFLSRI